MKRFSDVNDAMGSFERSEEILRSLPKYDMQDLERFGKVLSWHLYNICEAVLYVCCAHDASSDGTISFPELKDLPTFHKIPAMEIPDEVRKAAKRISKYSKPDLEKDMDLDELKDFLQAVNVFLGWDYKNLRVDEIRFPVERIIMLVEDLLDRLH